MQKNDKGSIKHLIEMLRALFGKDPNKPSINTIKVKKSDLENLQHNISVARMKMLHRSEELAKKGQHFKALVLETRAESMQSIKEILSDPEQNGARLDYVSMAAKFQERLEEKLEGIKDTKLYNQAQTDFARFQLSMDDMLKIDGDIIGKSFSDRNPAEAAFIRYMNAGTEEFCKGNIKRVASSAERNGLELGRQQLWDSRPDFTPSDPKEEARKRAGKDRADNIPVSPGEEPSGFEHKSIMPPEEKDDGLRL